MPVDPMMAGYSAIAGLEQPNPMQREAWGRVCDDRLGTGLLLKAPTGSGKTEAVSVPVLAAGDRRLIMVYPTRSLVQDQIGRFSHMLRRRSEQVLERSFSLVVDTGAQSARYVWKGGEVRQSPGSARRHLYHGDVIVTTLDKFLYRFFGFGEPTKSYIFPLRIHYGARKTLVCFDEAHAYEGVAFSNFRRLVHMLYEKAVDVVLMTATMPPAFVDEFDFLDRLDYIGDSAHVQALAAFERVQFPERCHPDKRLSYLPLSVQAPPSGGLSPAVEAMIDQARQRAAPSKRVIVTAERVADAAAIYKALRVLRPDVQVLLYHGRLTAPQRTRVYERLIDLERRDEGYVLVSTSAIEVGCDLDAHLLITQLCDPECLIQRAGRCNRKHRYPDAQVLVVGDTIPGWLTGLQAEDLAQYRAVIAALDGQVMDTTAIAACIRKQPVWDYRVEMMFDMLYEYVYEARLENKGLHDKGLVITRSWEPTLTLCTGQDADGRPQDVLEVPARQCAARNGEPLTPGVSLFKETYDAREHKWQRRPIGRWECAYAIDAVACLQGYPFDEELGYVDLPVVFGSRHRDGYRRVLVREENERTSRIWYIEPPSLEPEQGATEADSGGEEDSVNDDAD